LEDADPNGVPLEYFTFEERIDQTRRDFVNVPAMMEFYSRVYPYPFPRYAMTLGLFGGACAKRERCSCLRVGLRETPPRFHRQFPGMSGGRVAPE